MCGILKPFPEHFSQASASSTKTMRYYISTSIMKLIQCSA
jgi:hypothetical protein